MPTLSQLQSLYRVGYQLTYIMFQPIHLICTDSRTHNVYILAGYDEELEFQILPNGEFASEPS
ncbi:MAG: hypothetical protein LH679_19500 [Cyanobacteria bacterium CAN_BIN43]|nr:hypothetical protein [Cyanobacteria bacterium CAN_BIN43]